ncbi:agmatinase [Macrococcus armenti]|uniref:agmatinase n=1 Tax=Macrococcus armenti TaxID=2875764 RepID=UPI001CCB7E57|nr:agmatinase [Macrococcus armenti]UBH08260.1 agmatinase [Macrococcus armenti]UBH10491.1 agmatinase [Macrococcus armenti]UBH15039.1 agmatinase [Macrococcus armenti]UBH17399.1 agmatinase [Macrococcus armenti]UBH19664.1 agmatinase [Macrococcus armenti]
MMQPNKHVYMSCESSFDEATTVIYGAPFDGTVSNRPGTRFAADAIRSESYGLETYSPYLNKDLEDVRIMDSGDVDITIGNKVKVLDELEETARTILNAGKLPFMIGGEHLVTLGPMRAVLEKYPDAVLVQLDAHTDLRDDYMGEPLSHATVVRRIHDLVGDNRIYQYGIRSGTKEEFGWSDSHTVLEKFSIDTLKDLPAIIGNTPVYVTIDLDCLDPSIFPGTGTPEPGGLTYKELEPAFKVFEQLNVVAADIVELSPPYDHSGVSNAVAAKVARELMLAITK